MLVADGDVSLWPAMARRHTPWTDHRKWPLSSAIPTEIREVVSHSPRSRALIPMRGFIVAAPGGTQSQAEQAELGSFHGAAGFDMMRKAFKPADAYAPCDTPQ